MTFTIGRASGLTLQRSTIEGDRWSVAGFGQGTEDRCSAWVEQIAGMVDNPDEREFPVVWSVDARRDGFYRVLAASCDKERPYGTSGRVRWSAQLERVSNFTRPDVEIIATSKVRPNGHSWTDASLAARIGATGRSASAVLSSYELGLPGAPTFLACDGGQVVVFDVATAGAANGWISAEQPANRHYVGAAAIEQQIGTTWYPVTGRQWAPTVTAWRMTNGLIRWTRNGNGRLTLEYWRPASSAWVVAASEIALQGFVTTSSTWSAVTFGLASLPRIVRNDPQVVVVRWPGPNVEQLFVLRRGMRWGEVLVTTDTVSTNRRGIALHPAAAVTAVSDYVYSGADVNGYRVWLSTLSALTADTTNGRIRTTNVPTSPYTTFGFGVAPDVGSVTNSVQYWGSSTNTTQRVVT